MRIDAMARSWSRADFRHRPPRTLPNEKSVRGITTEGAKVSCAARARR